MNKGKNSTGRSIAKSNKTERIVKSPAKSGSLKPAEVEKAVKKVASIRSAR